MFSRAVAKLAPSATLAVNARAKELVAAGKTIINFAAGQPDFDTPQPIKDAAKRALDEGFTKYTPTTGIPELKQVLVKKLKLKNQLSYSPEQIIVSNGAKQVLFQAIMSLVDIGDEVIIKIPYWVSYPDMVKVARGKSVFINNWTELPKVIKRKTKVVIVNSPSNPTGEVIGREGLAAIAKTVVANPQIWILSDECYDCFYYGGTKPVSIASLNPKIYQQTLTINAFSKVFSMTGWRLGYGAGPIQLIKAMSNLQDQITSNPNSIAQKAGLVGWTEAGDFPEKMRREFKVRSRLMVDLLNQIPGIKAPYPDGAFYVWADVSRLTLNDQKFCNRLLEDGGVAVTPGSPFGVAGRIRLSFANSQEQIKLGLKLIKKFAQENYE